MHSALTLPLVGEVLWTTKEGVMSIRSCHFERNSVYVNQGGVIRTAHDIVTIINSTFLFNTARESSGGALIEWFR